MKPLTGRIIATVILCNVLRGAEDFRYGQPAQSQRAAADYVPDLAALAKPQSSELRDLVERFVADRKGLETMHPVPNSPLQLRRLAEFYRTWATKLAAMAYDQLGVEGRIDWHLMRAEMKYQLGLVERQQRRNAEMVPLLPFFEQLAGLQEQRREYAKPAGKAAAAVLADARTQLDAARQALESGLTEKPGENALKPDKIVALRAITQLQAAGKQLEDWFKHYEPYDPEFGWWTREPHKKLAAAMDDYAKFLREKIVGAKPGEDEPIVGDPIGAEGLAVDLEDQRFPTHRPS